MKTIAFVLDFFLVMAAIAAYLARPRIGGKLAKGLQKLTIGLLVLGLAPSIETVLFAAIHSTHHLNAVIYRLLLAGGFIFVIVGLARMRGAFED